MKGMEVGEHASTDQTNELLAERMDSDQTLTSISFPETARTDQQQAS